MPTGINFFGTGLAFSDGDINFDPVLEIEDATFESYVVPLVYLHSFNFFGRSARVDVLLPYATGRWEGLLQGEPASTRRHGFGDPRMRLSVLLYGGKAQTPEEFISTPQPSTVVGAAVSIQAPFGEYMGDRLINLGTNRWTIRPQLGVTHTRGKWTFELTGSLYWFSENDDFFGGATLDNDVLGAIQAHAIYTFKPGLWISASSGYGHGADAVVNGQAKESRTEAWLNALNFGFPINRENGLKLSFQRYRTQNDKGADFNTIVFAWSRMF